jgi:hypothetical protein
VLGNVTTVITCNDDGWDAGAANGKDVRIVLYWDKRLSNNAELGMSAAGARATDALCGERLYYLI